MSELWQRTNFRNPDIDFLVNVQITEYDMKDAGLSLTKKFKLLPASDIAYLESLSKEIRKIKMGLIQRENKEYRRALNDAFREGRKLFFEANGLDVENILAIKKDAIFTINMCHETDFGELVFAEKNTYSSYYLFDRYEFYYFREGMDVKGIGDSNVLKHAEYMITSLHDFMHKMETSSRTSCIRYIKDFVKYYKNMELAIEYYRELNSDSMYRLKRKFNGRSLGIEDTLDKSLIDINYNYNTYLMNIIKILT